MIKPIVGPTAAPARTHDVTGRHRSRREEENIKRATYPHLNADDGNIQSQIAFHFDALFLGLFTTFPRKLC